MLVLTKEDQKETRMLLGDANEQNVLDDDDKASLENAIPALQDDVNPSSKEPASQDSHYTIYMLNTI